MSKRFMYFAQRGSDMFSDTDQPPSTYVYQRVEIVNLYIKKTKSGCQSIVQLGYCLKDSDLFVIFLLYETFITINL